MRVLAPLFGAVCLLSAAMPAWALDMVGQYGVQGTGPDGAAYKGTVAVTKTSPDTYQVVWMIDGTSFVGTGIGGNGFMAVAYKSGSDTGIALYSTKDDASAQGVWTYAGGKTIGTEAWARK